jgi:hypothetical protein
VQAGGGRWARARRWILPVVLGVEVALVTTGRLSAGTAVAVVLALEAVLALTVLSQVAVALVRFRERRRGGAGPAEATRTALREVLPRPLADAVLHELRLFHSLALWLRRRTSGVPPDAVTISYERSMRPFVLVVAGLSAVELLAVELVVPWPLVRIVLLVLGAYALVVVLGFGAANAVRPHVLTPEVLRLRAGIWVDVPIATAEIASARARLGATTRMAELADGVLSVAAAKQTDVEVHLARPIRVRAGRQEGDVHTVRLAADDPDRAVAALRDAAPGRTTRDRTS